MDENKDAAMELRVKNLERQIREIQEELRNMTIARPQRDTSSSPAPQRDVTNYRRPTIQYGSGSDENPFAPEQEDGPFGPYSS